MNTKFNLGAIEVKIPAGECNPEINLAIKDVSYEVTDMSLTEYGAVFKGVFSEAMKAVKDFHAVHKEENQLSMEREEKLHALRMKELELRNKRFETSIPNKRSMEDAPACI